MYQDEIALAAHREFGASGTPEQQKLYEAIMAAPDLDYTPQTNEEIAEIAMGIFKGHLWVRSSMSDEAAMMFMPLALCGHEQLLSLVKLGAYCYEHIDKAGPRSVNGLPSFFSMKIISATDWEKVVTKLDAIKGAVAAV